MQIVFVTNFYNHHQAALAEAFDRQTNHDFVFIETQPMNAERKNMGWSNADVPAYVKKTYVSEKERIACQQMINAAEVVIWGSCPFKMIQPRLRAKKLTFCYSERIFKKGFGPIAFGGRAVKYWLRHWRYQENHYLLCASSYAASDYAKLGLFLNKAYKWGYFPKVNTDSRVEELIASKRENSLLWAGRMIDWKHPEIAVEIAYRLKQAGFLFDMNMIGDGDCYAMVQEQIRKLRLEDCVHLLGAMPPDQVRKHMEESSVFLFTSDQNEGWGAVVNEAMSSACAVVASDAAGSVKYLIENGANGLVYHNKQMDKLYQQVALMLKNQKQCCQYGQRAYDTMEKEWSADSAATRFIALAQSVLEKRILACSNGPCAKAM